MEEEFYQKLSDTSDIQKSAFENNWPYILQATRNGLYTKENKTSVVYYTTRHQGDSSCLVIVNALGQERKQLIIDFAQQAFSEGKKIIIKNINKTELNWWLKSGFRETTEDWSRYSFRDDNSFSQYNISYRTVKNLEFSNSLRRVIRRFNRKRKIITELYNFKYDEKSKELLGKFSKYSENKGNDFAIEIENGHRFFFDESIKNKIRLQHIENDELVGFSFLTPVNGIIFYNALICRTESNLMKYLLFQSLTLIIQNYPKTTLFGIQGSESEGQDNFKRKFKPSEIIEKTHLTII